jgi:thiol-disulfide isomerase/thioredoxin
MTTTPVNVDLRMDPYTALHRSGFDQALTYAAYVATANEAQQVRWNTQYAAGALTDAQRELLGGFTRRMPVLSVSGIWCGDCMRDGAILQRIAEAAPAIELRFLDRDVFPELRDHLRVTGGRRVPATLLLDEDFQFVDRLGDRSLATYRRMAHARLGDSCPTGIAAPAADEIAAVTAEFIDRFERAQLLLRLAPQLRERHAD